MIRGLVVYSLGLLLGIFFSHFYFRNYVKVHSNEEYSFVVIDQKVYALIKAKTCEAK